MWVFGSMKLELIQERQWGSVCGGHAPSGAATGCPQIGLVLGMGLSLPCCKLSWVGLDFVNSCIVLGMRCLFI